MLTFVEYVKIKSIDKKKLDKIGDHAIYTVDASAIHDADQTFNRFATHIDSPKLVPVDEIWIDKNVSQKEQQFLIQNAIHKYKGKKNGKRWNEYAEKKEKSEREKTSGVKFQPEKFNTKPVQKVYSKYYCGIPTPDDDVEVWLVDEKAVRSLFKSDFFESGNGEVYKWIPRQEIWINKDLKDKEIDLAILHEYIENTLMRQKKIPYEKAHVVAQKVEWLKRKKWEVSDVKELNRDEALALAKKYFP